MSVWIAAGAFVLYLIAYNTYGRYLARKLFKLDGSVHTPAHALADGVDYVPSRKQIVFGHHFTSIAGTGPIVGPAIAIIWGWLPALIWVLVGSVFMGAVHDFGSLVVSMRHRGRSIADVCNELVGPRVRVLFLCIITFGLIIVIAIFCLVIANIFGMWPESVFPVWMEVPIALVLGYVLTRVRSSKAVILSTVIAVGLMYLTVWMGASLDGFRWAMPSVGTLSPVVVWSIILLVYCFFASVLPVQRLLQPRDFINAYQLYIAFGLLALGVFVARPDFVAPRANLAPANAPSPWPLLFITIACGAISGFHSLVSGGTTSKQLNRETDAQVIGYGSMLLEGALAVLVIISVGAGLGLNYKVNSGDLAAFREAHPAVEITEGIASDGGTEHYVQGKAAFDWHYRSWDAASGLAPKVGALMTGASNMITRLGLPMVLCMTIMGVFVASFAGTTLDTATRLQRYIIGEFGDAAKIKWLANRYVATFVTVLLAGVLALWDGEGKGALILWPLFGTVNQLIAALALMVVAVYLHRKRKPIWVAAIPFAIMVGITGWAMAVKLPEFFQKEQYHLLIIGIAVSLLEVWMIVEVLLRLRRPHTPEPAQP